MKRFLLNILCANVFIFMSINAQQLPLFSDYEINSFFVNPAFSGSSGYNNVNLLARSQWLGYNEGPSTYVLTGEYRLLKKPIEVKSSSGLFGMKKKLSKRSKGRMGLGAAFYTDKNGHMGKTGGFFSYAYHIKMHHSQLSFGLASSFSQFNIDENALHPEEKNDLLLEGGNLNNSYGMDATVGALLDVKGIYYLGFACNEVLQTIDLGADLTENFNVLRHYYLSTGYNFKLDYDYHLESSFLLKFTELWRFQGDISLRLKYKELWWGGFSYRTNNDLVLIAGVRMDKIHFSYSFDYGFSKVMRNTYGSHELNLGIRLGYGDRKLRWKHQYF